MTQRLKCSGIGHGIEAQLGPWLRRLRAPEARRAGRASSAYMYLHDIAPMHPLPRVHKRSHNTAGEPSRSVKRMRPLSTLVRFLSVGFLALGVEATRSTLHREVRLQPMCRCAMAGRGPRVIRPAHAMASQITNRLMRGCIASSGHIPYIACSSGRSSLTQWVARKPCEVDGAWHSGKLRVILAGGWACWHECEQVALHRRRGYMRERRIGWPLSVVPCAQAKEMSASITQAPSLARFHHRFALSVPVRGDMGYR